MKRISPSKESSLTINSRRPPFLFNESQTSESHAKASRRPSSSSQYTVDTLMLEDDSSPNDTYSQEVDLERAYMNNTSKNLINKLRGMARERRQRRISSCCEDDKIPIWSYYSSEFSACAKLLLIFAILTICLAVYYIIANKGSMTQTMITQIELEQTLPGAFLTSSYDGSVVAVARTLQAGRGDNTNSSPYREIQVYRRQDAATQLLQKQGKKFEGPWKPIGQPLEFHESSISPVQLSGHGNVIALVTSSLVTTTDTSALHRSVQILHYDELRDRWIDPATTAAYRAVRSTFPGHAVCLSSDGTTLVVVESSRPWSGATHKTHQHYLKMYTFDGSKWHLLVETANLSVRPQVIKLSADGSTLIVAGQGDDDLSNTSTLKVYKQQFSVDFVRDGGELMTITKIGTSETATPTWVQWGDEMVLKASDPIRGHKQFEVALSYNGDILAVASGGLVEVFFSFGGAMVGDGGGLEEWHQMGQTFIANATRQALQEDLRQPEEEHPIIASNNIISSVALTQDGRRMVLGITQNHTASPSMVQHYSYNRDKNIWERSGPVLQNALDPTFGKQLSLTSSFSSSSDYDAILVASSDAQGPDQEEVYIHKVVSVWI